MRKSTRRIAVIAAAIGTAVAAAGVAVAVMIISGTGTLNAHAADQSKPLHVTQVQLTGSLVPGGPYVGVKAYVSNPNDFTVAVDTLRADPTGTGSTVNGYDANHWANLKGVADQPLDRAVNTQAWLSAQPCHYYLNDGANNTKTYALSTPVTLAPGEAKWIVWNKVISQDPHSFYGDTSACDLKMAVTVSGKPNGQPTNNG